MSVYSIVELLCYFESFRNVDLFEQGYYCVRAKIYCEKSSTSAVPLINYNTSCPVRKIENPRHKLFPPQITKNTYTTKTFWVQFTEEVIDINETVHFRIEASDLENQVLILELELLFSPEPSTTNTDMLKPVSQQKYRMKSMQCGMNQFYPVIFDEWHFAVVRFAVHSTLLDFSYKPPLSSFFKLPNFSSNNNSDQDRADVSLFGMTCRKNLQESYTKLTTSFQKLCVHVPAKQRATLGADYFVAPALILSPTSRSHSAPSSPVTPKSNRPSTPTKRPSTPTKRPSTPTKSSSRPSTPTTRSNSVSSLLHDSSSELPEEPQLPRNITPPPPSTTPPPDFGQSTTPPPGSNLLRSVTPPPNYSTSLRGSTPPSGSADDLIEDYIEEEVDVEIPPPSSDPIAPPPPAPNSTEAKLANLKLYLLLNNVRDQNGIGSPRAPSLCVPPPTGTPPPFITPDIQTTNTIIAGNPPSRSTSASSLSTSPGITRFSASTGSRPSTPRDCASATFGFFSRPSTPMASPSSSAPPSPNFELYSSQSTATPTGSATDSDLSTSAASNLSWSSSYSYLTSSNSSNSSNTSASASPSNANLSSSSTSSISTGISPSPSLSNVVVDSTNPDSHPLIHPLRLLTTVPSLPSLVEARNTKKTARRSVTYTTRPALGPIPQENRAKEIMNQIHFMGDQIFALWLRFTKIFHLVGKENTFRIAQKYEQKYLKLFRESVFREVAHVSNMTQMLELQANPVRHRQMVTTVRNSEYYKKLKTARFELVIPRLELVGQPIILEQVIDSSRYATPEEITVLTASEDDASPTPSPPPLTRSKSKSFSVVNNPPRTCTGSHLYIMVHGLAGNPWDMRLFRNQIALNFPESEFLICSCVEQNTLGDIEEMGNNVAKEIAEFLQKTTLTIGKISFVGHSLGGVIIRAALCDPLLAPYLNKLYTFVSLSVPHIGTLYPYSSLIPGAMWVWQKWSNSSCLLQLRLIDNTDPTKTYLYKLSQQKGLEYFQNILLVSSEQDLYVPFHSARIEVCQEALADASPSSRKSERKREEKERGKDKEKSENKETSAPLVAMVRNMWEGVLEGWKARGRFGEIVRYDVVFESHRGMDGIIGRSAHIRMLDSPKVMQMLITTNANLFE